MCVSLRLHPLETIFCHILAPNVCRENNVSFSRYLDFLFLMNPQTPQTDVTIDITAY